jgi:hypothetical protein
LDPFRYTVGTRQLVIGRHVGVEPDRLKARACDSAKLGMVVAGQFG